MVLAIRVIRLEPLEEPKVEEPSAANEPDSADRRSRLGDARVQIGQLDEAIEEYQKSIELDPKNAQRHFKIGLVYQSLGRFEDALGAYQQATRLEPQSAWAHAAVSIVHAKMGNQDAALAEYQVVKNLNVELAKGVLEVLGRYGGVHDV